MEAYIYNADIYCEICANRIKKGLEKEGFNPLDFEDEKTFDSNEFPKGPFSDGGGESDSPQHCGECHCPLNNDLTHDGVKYVVEYLKEFCEGSGGSGEVLDGWARQLNDYELDEEQTFVLTAFKIIRQLQKNLVAAARTISDNQAKLD